MPQIVGTPGLGYGGMQLGNGPNGPVAIFFGSGDPNTISDPSLDRTTVNNAEIGSLYLQIGVGPFKKTAAPNTWTAF
jgi:hypothetical protein